MENDCDIGIYSCTYVYGPMYDVRTDKWSLMSYEECYEWCMMIAPML